VLSLASKPIVNKLVTTFSHFTDAIKYSPYHYIQQRCVTVNNDITSNLSCMLYEEMVFLTKEVKLTSSSLAVPYQGYF